MTEKFHFSNIKDIHGYKPRHIEIPKDFFAGYYSMWRCYRHVMPWDFKCLTCAGQFCTKKNWSHIWTKKKKVAYLWKCIYFVFNIKWKAPLKSVYCVRIMYLYTQFKLWCMQGTSNVFLLWCLCACMTVYESELRPWTINPLSLNPCSEF